MTTATDKKRCSLRCVDWKIPEKVPNYTREDVKKSIRLEPTICKELKKCWTQKNLGLNHLQKLIVGLNIQAQKVFKITWLFLAHLTQ